MHRLVAQSPPDSLAYFALRRDKTYFFEKDRRAALAYRAAAGIVLVSGDPVGDSAAFDDLLAQFAALCRTKAWRIAVIGVAANMRPGWARIGLRSIYVGDEAEKQALPAFATADEAEKGASPGLRRARISVPGDTGKLSCWVRSAPRPPST